MEVTEPILPGPAQAPASLLDVPEPDGTLPLLWHWLYLLDRPAQADLGPDGHPVRGTILATPGPGRRRMWAGGRVRAPGALRVGETATRTSEVLAVREKDGRSGPLTFVTVAHRITQAGRLVVDDDVGPRPLRPPDGEGNPAPDGMNDSFMPSGDLNESFMSLLRPRPA